MTRDEAVAKADSKWWEAATDGEIVEFQLYEHRLCMPFGEFHRAVEAILDRGVFSHEFGSVGTERLQQEHKGLIEKGTCESSMGLLADLADGKPIIVGIVTDEAAK